MERIAIEAGCLGTQDICKTHENNVVEFVHFLHVHVAVTWLCLLSLLIICQFHHWSVTTVVSIISLLWGEKQHQLKRLFWFSLTYVKGLEVVWRWCVQSCDSIAPENWERLLGWRSPSCLNGILRGIRKTPLPNIVTARQFLWSRKLALTLLHICQRTLIRVRWRQLFNWTQMLNFSDCLLFPLIWRKWTQRLLLV